MTQLPSDWREAGYMQIAKELRERIAKGTIRPGERLPSYRALSSEFGVSLSVVQRAVRQLREEELIEVQHGKEARTAGDRPVRPGLAKFGFIHPYTPSTHFSSALIAFLLEAFEANREECMLTIRSSNDDSERERAFAETMAYNGLHGLILSPFTGSQNAAYFAELARKIPVMLIDQTFDGVALPGVVFDFAAAGDEIGAVFRQRDCRRLLTVLNTSNNRSVAEMFTGIRRKFKGEISTLELPLFDSERALEQRDYAPSQQLARQLRDVFRSGGFDAVFCPYLPVFDRLFLREVPLEERRHAVLGTLSFGLNSLFSRELCESGVLIWEHSERKLLFEAARRLLNWYRGAPPPRGIRKIRLERLPVIVNPKRKESI